MGLARGGEERRRWRSGMNMDRVKPRTKRRRLALAEQNRKEHFNDGSIIYLCKEKGLGHKHVQGRR